MLSRIASLVLTRPPRLAPEAPSFTFVVDGVSVLAEGDGKSARLTCVLSPKMPDDAQLREMLSRLLRKVRHGPEALCSDAEGRLVLMTRIGPDDDMRERVTRFCDAAVYWAGAARRLLETPPRLPSSPTMIFP